MFTTPFFILQLPKMFPGLLMNLQIYARELPMFSFHPGVVKLGFQGAAKAFAIQPNGTQTPLFKLNVVSTFVFSICKCLCFYYVCQKCIKVVVVDIK